MSLGIILFACFTSIILYDWCEFSFCSSYLFFAFCTLLFSYTPPICCFFSYFFSPIFCRSLSLVFFSVFFSTYCFSYFITQFFLVRLPQQFTVKSHIPTGGNVSLLYHSAFTHNNAKKTTVLLNAIQFILHKLWLESDTISNSRHTKTVGFSVLNSESFSLGCLITSKQYKSD